MENEKYKERKARSEEMLKQGVEPIKNGFNEYFIPSQTEQGRKYKVAINNGWYKCECKDNEAGNLCKHIILLKTYFAITLKAKEVKRAVSVAFCCPYCNSQQVVKDGTRKTTMGLKQRWLCSECSGRFVNEPIKKIKGNADAITLAMDLYFKGNSYRDIKDTLRQSFGLKVHHETIRRWINTYMARINEYTSQFKPAQLGKVWAADEQKIKLKKEDAWVWSWNCMDKQTRFLLANQITKEREIVDARRLFRQAKANANSLPEMVTTDGLQSYRKAVRKEFSSYQNRNPHVRVRKITARVNNNTIERYHGTFRERDKVMRGFQNGNTANTYNENFRTYYNYLKPHMALGGKTPAQATGINEPSEWKSLLLKAIQNTGKV